MFILDTFRCHLTEVVKVKYRFKNFSWERYELIIPSIRCPCKQVSFIKELYKKLYRKWFHYGDQKIAPQDIGD